mmetsp:Transcript_88575/g.141001  ORF Transcript_88575/g.141001 Transcript_88575/m.141001 type:complete len:297 (-) Transcript_88575:233-1123(-)
MACRFIRLASLCIGKTGAARMKLRFNPVFWSGWYLDVLIPPQQQWVMHMGLSRRRWKAWIFSPSGPRHQFVDRSLEIQQRRIQLLRLLSLRPCFHRPFAQLWLICIFHLSMETSTRSTLHGQQALRDEEIPASKRCFRKIKSVRRRALMIRWVSGGCAVLLQDTGTTFLFDLLRCAILVGRAERVQAKMRPPRSLLDLNWMAPSGPRRWRRLLNAILKTNLQLISRSTFQTQVPRQSSKGTKAKLTTRSSQTWLAPSGCGPVMLIDWQNVAVTRTVVMWRASAINWTSVKTISFHN